MGIHHTRRLTPGKGEGYHADVEFKRPYLTQQIIAYIGNKRRLLPLIHRAIQQIFGDTIPQGLKFADPFAGSGVVSRLAKVLNLEVVSNDWEPYAFIIGKAYLETNASDLEKLFGSPHQFCELLAHLNDLPDPPPEDQYIALYYAPASDEPEKADFRKERLFYTRQNALRIDRIRNEIDRLYPPPRGYGASGFRPSDNSSAGDKASRCRELLIALLLYEAATHTNTSGVFKAYHRGFGGHGKDALGRILRPIHLKPPPLIDSLAPCRMYREDATSLFRYLGQSFDLVYLDPPYNQHQYGSNYHLLNTIVLWDKVPVPIELGPDGRLRDKAGIRKDWKKTKSAYCYRETAIGAFSELLGAIDAEHLLISYSTDGIIPFETLRKLCAAHGEVSILTNEYITYRGGKQSNHRRDRNVEFVLWVRKGRNGKGAGGSHRYNVRTEAAPAAHAMSAETPPSKFMDTTQELERVLAIHRIRLLFRRVYREEALRTAFVVQPEGVGRYRVQIPLRGTILAVPFRYLMEPVCPIDLHCLSTEDLFLLEERLQSVVCSTRKEELDALLTVLPETLGRDRSLYQRKILTVLRKLAHRKYRTLFLEAWDKVIQGFSSTPLVLPFPQSGLSKETENAKIPQFVTPLSRQDGQARNDGNLRFSEELERIRTVAELRFSDRR